MRLIVHAIRAVFIEMLGVILVVWLLFGSALWTFERYTTTETTSRIRQSDGQRAERGPLVAVSRGSFRPFDF